MINRCKVEMKGGELYNVVESLKEGDRRTVSGTEEIELYVRDPFLCFYFFLQTVQSMGSQRVGQD